MNYTWNEVAGAVNELYCYFNHRDIEDPVRNIYHTALPKAIMDMLALMYAHDYDRSKLIAKIVLNGYFQLENNGRIKED